MNTQANITAVKNIYGKRDMEVPADGLINVTVVEQCKTVRDVEELLRESGFTATAAKAMISRFKKGAESREGITEQNESVEDILRKGVENLHASIMLNAMR
jgi:hypothetical protein